MGSGRCATTANVLRSEHLTFRVVRKWAAMQGGAEHTVVLRGNAVNYAVAGQGAPGLSIGVWKQTQAPRMDNDIGVERVFQRRG
jgi:hypothetical protein